MEIHANLGKHDDFVLEATPRIELGMEVLQTSALPLGYVAALPELDSTFAATEATRAARL